MTIFKIIPDDQRLAVTRGNGACRIIGPGIVFLPQRSGTTVRPLSIGDLGELVTRGRAKFGDVLLSVELRGAETSGAVRIVGFRANAVVAAASDAGTSAAENDAASARQIAAPRYTARAFWIGMPLVVFLATVSWMGVLHAAGQVITERAVYSRGVPATGTVVRKIRYHQTQNGEQTHYVAYAFQTPAGITFRKEIRIEPRVWNDLRENGPIAVRYVPGRPEQNLPDGWHLSGYYYLVGAIALAGALLFTVVAAGMLIKKFSGGYRGESHSFLGGRPPR